MTRYQQDLAWILRSPELLALTQSYSTDEFIQRMSIRGDFNYTETYRLGVYFEQLWQHLVESADGLNTIKHNQQVIIDKHTYGEFDSILYDQTVDKVIHCELAVKFYLKIGSGDLLSHWVGPNLRDRFDDKYHRLFEHQLRLSEQPIIHQWLQQRNIHINQIKVLTRGRLFYPIEEYMAESFQFPKEVNPQHLKGFWITWQDFAHLQLSSAIEWYILPKKFWLADVSVTELDALKRLDEKSILIHGHNEKYQFQRVQQVIGVRHGEEIIRGFVVTKDWLDKARARVEIT